MAIGQLDWISLIADKLDAVNIELTDEDGLDQEDSYVNFFNEILEEISDIIIDKIDETIERWCA